jgi:hypothetical protein
VGAGFRKRSCSNNKIERDDDSKKGHRALAPGFMGVERRLSAFCRNALRNTSILRDPLHDDPAVETGGSHVRSTSIPLDHLSAVTARDHNLQRLHRTPPLAYS